MKKDGEEVKAANQNPIVIYNNKDGKINLNVLVENETVWLNQEQLSVLFGKSKSTINEHVKNIFHDGELVEFVNMKKFGNSEFAKKPVNYYDLDMVISVGYRVKSTQGIHFRIWATDKLKQYIVKGFALNDERLKQGCLENLVSDFDDEINRIGNK